MLNSVIAKVKKTNKESLSTVVKKNAFYSLLLKVLSVLLSFWSIRVAFEFTGSQQIYGLWLTILSVISWLGLLNGGLGNGLRNKLSRAIATNNIENAKIYVSTSYVIISVIATTCCLIFTIATLFIDWRHIFNANYVSKEEFLLLFLIVVVSYLLQLILMTLNAICFAYNQSSLPSLFTLVSNFLYVICLYVLKLFNFKGILILGFVYSVTILVVLILANLYLFSSKYQQIKPEFKYFNKLYINELMGNGIKFFLLEISAVIIFTTDTMVITNVVGSKEVAVYQLVMKLFSVFTIIASTVMVPLWSAYTHAYSKGDVIWIRKTMNKILLMLIPFVIGVIIFSFFVNPILRIWIGNGIIASNLLIFVIAIYIIINVWSNIFAYLLNGINKVNGQLIAVGIGAILNIPFSIYFAKDLGFGTVGVVLGTILCLAPFALVGPIISFKKMKELESYNSSIKHQNSV
ncbi:oligosaccharide flippase family protein [Gottfriedia sp. NPDC058432]|uniref:oligosaccharide flippase family protein n=1 Tax=Gottfriedia sp. NPDC058432 TaxID=3346497 RepID=UPI00364D00A0